METQSYVAPELLFSRSFMVLILDISVIQNLVLEFANCTMNVYRIPKSEWKMECRNHMRRVQKNQSHYKRLMN